jgi:hypothetical protein
LLETVFYSEELIKLKENQSYQLLPSLSQFLETAHTAYMGTVHDLYGYCSAAQQFVFSPQLLRPNFDLSDIKTVGKLRTSSTRLI